MRTMLRCFVILAVLFTSVQGLLAQDASLRGDCNADSVLDAGDVAALAIRLTANPVNPASCDVNGDALLNQADVICLQEVLFSATASCQTAVFSQSVALLAQQGDCNADGLIDAGDIAALAQRGGSIQSGAGSPCDLNSDGVVSVQDVDILSGMIFSQ